jgi:plastocyanin
LCILILAATALSTTRSTGQPAVAAEPPTALPAVSVPVPSVPSATPRATQTPQVITSIILRDTPAPYPTSTPRPANQPTVSIVDFSFMPGTIRITAGQTITWHNDGTEQHDVTGNDWHSGPLDPNSTYYLTFGVPGTYPYRCSIHLDMTGSVIVSQG